METSEIEHNSWAPAAVRGVIRLIRLIPPAVTLAFAVWAAAAAAAGRGDIALGAGLMSLLAMSVAARTIRG